MAPTLDPARQVVLLGQRGGEVDLAHFVHHGGHVLFSRLGGEAGVEPHDTCVDAPPIRARPCCLDGLAVPQLTHLAVPVVHPRGSGHVEERRQVRARDEVEVEEDEVAVRQAQGLDLAEDVGVPSGQRRVRCVDQLDRVNAGEHSFERGPRCGLLQPAAGTQQDAVGVSTELLEAEAYEQGVDEEPLLRAVQEGDVGPAGVAGRALGL
mmetsp:Transcript_130339/g.325113  ORF Transcript_130339/g.325113 Transcript_130339/m.325113 type:complete len:208 (-) Transcript_130339:561-1184(-)